MSGAFGGYKSPVSKSVPYDDSVVAPPLNADDVQAAIDAIKIRVANSASPGFTWGRSGNSPPDTWMINDSVPSNRSGRTIALTGAEVAQIFVANEDPDIFTLGVYWHEGAEVNLTSIGTVTTAAQRGNTFSTSFAVPFGKQLAIKIVSGSTKNVVIGLQLKGSI